MPLLVLRSIFCSCSTGTQSIPRSLSRETQGKVNHCTLSNSYLNFKFFLFWQLKSSGIYSHTDKPGVHTDLCNCPYISSLSVSECVLILVASQVAQCKISSIKMFISSLHLLVRAMNSAPYNICKKAADHANSGSGGLGFSATSDAQGYISLSTCKETSTEI